MIEKRKANWGQEGYDHEWSYAEHPGRASVVCLGKENPLGQKARIASECAYRRGYFQGFFFALDALKRGASARDLEGFLFKEVYEWRLASHGGNLNPPPGSPYGIPPAGRAKGKG